MKAVTLTVCFLLLAFLSVTAQSKYVWSVQLSDELRGLSHSNESKTLLVGNSATLKGLYDRNKNLFKYFIGVGGSLIEYNRNSDFYLKDFIDRHELSYNLNAEEQDIQIHSKRYTTKYVSIPLGIQFTISEKNNFKLINEIEFVNYFRYFQSTDLTYKRVIDERTDYIFGWTRLIYEYYEDHPIEMEFIEKNEKTSPYILDINYSIIASFSLGSRVALNAGAVFSRSLILDDSPLLSKYMGAGLEIGLVVNLF